MPLRFGRSPKASVPPTDGDSATATSISVTASASRSAPSSPKRISPLRVQIPDDDDSFTDLRPAELTPDAVPPPPSSPTSAPSSPHPNRLQPKQSQMRSLSVMSYRLKQLVSKEKRRFDGDGFNLDLTYVTDRLIAFGYPAENLEGIYRNHYKDVYNFFERRHAEQYRIYNLCAERTYDKEKFHNRVAEFPFYDHCPPPLALFVPFCQDVATWLDASDHNVAAVHCKAGKGRTGVMICAYLLYTRVWRTAYAALEFFGAARSLKREGVTIPSQQRFIRYFAQLCHDADERSSDADVVRELAMQPSEFHQLWEETMDGRGLCLVPKQAPVRLTLPPTARLVLTRIRIHGVYAHKRIDPRVRIECGVGKMAAAYDVAAAVSETTASTSTSRPVTPTSAVSTPASSSTPKGSSAFWSTVDLEIPCDRLLVWDEVKVALRHRNGKKVGHFWFHTAFVSPASRELTVLKDEIDKLHKDVKKGHKRFAADFAISLVFEHATPDDVAGLRATRRTQSAPDAMATPPATPTRPRPYASLGGLGGASPGRTRAASDQHPHPTTEDAAVAPRSPSASMLTRGKVSPATSSASAPATPKGFSMRFFSFGKRETSVSVADDAHEAPMAEDDGSDSSSSAETK